MAGIFDKLSIAGLKGGEAAFAIAGVIGGGIFIATKLLPGSPKAPAAAAGPTTTDVISALRSGAQVGSDVAIATLGPATQLAQAGLEAGARLGETATTSLAAAVQTQSAALADVSRTAVAANAQATIAAIDRITAPAPQTTIFYDITKPYTPPPPPPPPAPPAPPRAVVFTPPPAPPAPMMVLGPAPAREAPPATPAPVAAAAPPPVAQQLGRPQQNVQPLIDAIERGDIPAAAVLVKPDLRATATQVTDARTGITYDPRFGLFDTAVLNAGAAPNPGAIPFPVAA